jgi:hypothetical protein
VQRAPRRSRFLTADRPTWPHSRFRPTVGFASGDTASLVAETRHQRVIPHVAQKNKGRSAIDGCTSRHTGSLNTQRKRAP